MGFRVVGFSVPKPCTLKFRELTLRSLLLDFLHPKQINCNMAGVVPQTVWSHCGVTGLRVERFCCSVRRTCGRRTPAVLWLPLRRSAHFRLNRILSTVLLRPHMEAIVGAPELATCSRHSAIHVRGCLVEILLPPHSGARLSLQTVSPQQSRSLPPGVIGFRGLGFWGV